MTNPDQALFPGREWGVCQKAERAGEGAVPPGEEILKVMESIDFRDSFGGIGIFRVRRRPCGGGEEFTLLWRDSAFAEMAGLPPCRVFGDAAADNPAEASVFWDETLAEAARRATTVGLCCRGKGDCYYEAAVSCAADDLILVRLRDVSERRSLIGKILALEERLGQSSKMEAMGNLAGGIAHDFNNILTAVIGWAELLRHDVNDDPRPREKVERIMKAGIRAKELVDQILSFSGKANNRVAPTCVASVVREALALLRATIPTSVSLVPELSGNCGLVMMSPVMIHQLVMNLCTNAYHALEEERGSIFLTLAPAVEQEKQYVKLVVGDTGKGIPPQDIQRIFEPFFTTKESGSGTGMGLAVVNGIVRSCGGTVEVESTPWRGTSFTILLPRWIEGKSSLPETPEAAAVCRKADILLVDDEPEVLVVMTRMLERMGHRVTATTRSREALEIFFSADNGFDLVITDQAMPEFTGDRLAREILSRNSEVPLILCTGYSSRINEEKAKRLGVKAFLYKPVVGRELAAIVEQVLQENTGQGRGRRKDGAADLPAAAAEG